MIIFTIKLLKSIKNAIAGRKYPHQLAGAVAFGALLGVVPHGNLLALAILIVVLSLRINHAMAGLTAIGVSFAATRLDPVSHQVGNYILGHPKLADRTAEAWQLPLMPWTDLNNTVVMGSFAIGVAALLPIFMLTYPVFRMFAPTRREEIEDQEIEQQRETRNVAKHSVVLVDQGTQEVSAPHIPGPETPATETADVAPAPSFSVALNSSKDHESASDESQLPDFQEVVDENDSLDANATAPVATKSFQRIDPANDVRSSGNEVAETDTAPLVDQDSKHVSVETRIDVIRMKDYQFEQNADDKPVVEQAAPKQTVQTETPPPPTDEALNYLLRQLRDSQQQRKAG